VLGLHIAYFRILFKVSRVRVRVRVRVSISYRLDVFGLYDFLKLKRRSNSAARAYGARNPFLSPIRSPYVRPVPAATKPAILVMTSFATGHAQHYGRTEALPRLIYKDVCACVCVCVQRLGNVRILTGSAPTTSSVC